MPNENNIINAWLEGLNNHLKNDKELDKELIKKFLENKVDLNLINESNNPLNFIIARQEGLDIVKQFLKFGFSPRSTDYSLHNAIDILDSINENPVLNEETRKYFLKLTTLMIKYGLESNKINEQGETELSRLCKKSFLNVDPENSILKALKKSDDGFKWKNNDGETLLDLIMKNINHECQNKADLPDNEKNYFKTKLALIKSKLNDLNVESKLNFYKWISDSHVINKNFADVDNREIKKILYDGSGKLKKDMFETVFNSYCASKASRYNSEISNNEAGNILVLDEAPYQAPINHSEDFNNENNSDIETNEMAHI